MEQGIDLVAICRDAGNKVDAWTFTLADPAGGFSDREWRDFSRLLALGVDQITTDEAIATEQAYLARMEGARPRAPF
jgi:glycerophosphoryl diester phosphodiesterase